MKSAPFEESGDGTIAPPPPAMPLVSGWERDILGRANLINEAISRVGETLLLRSNEEH